MDGNEFKQRIINLIFNTIDEINSQLSKEHQLRKSTKTVLFGKNGNLDSLGLNIQKI